MSPSPRPYAFQETVLLRDEAHGSLTTAATLSSASSGLSGAAKMRGQVAVRRYAMSVGQVTQGISGPTPQSDEATGALVTVARAVRRVKKHVCVDRVAH